MYRILVVEDDRGIAGAIKTQAEMWDLSVRCVEDFRGVMAEFAAYDPHLVLMDVGLPFLMATIGAGRSARYRRRRLFSYPPRRIT